MIRIGIVGAENTHSAAIARTLNVERRVPGFAVVAIWGETKAFAAKTAEAGRIPTIVKKPADMIGEIDAVVIDHRHPRHHLPAAEPFLKASLPMFIDKPFCYRLTEGKRFLARARRMRVPVTSFSTVPTYATYAALARQVGKAAEVCAAASFGPCEIDSKYGGIFFYGIHQVDVLMELFGPAVKAVRVAKGPGGAEAVVSLHFKGGLTASMHCLRSRASGFQVAVATGKGPLAARLAADANPYLTGIRRFCRMFRTGVEPIEHRRILAPVAALEAMEKSVRTGRLTDVARV
jgi:predicted dehydrogenase